MLAGAALVTSDDQYVPRTMRAQAESPSPVNRIDGIKTELRVDAALFRGVGDAAAARASAVLREAGDDSVRGQFHCPQRTGQLPARVRAGDGG
jgi:hypothetical protein